MRLLIKLRCIKSCKYEMQYHYHLQGFIYRLLGGSKYHYVHDKEGYKFFCFSNIFPANDLEKDELRTLMVSSPNSEFISYLYDALQKWKTEVRIGNMAFRTEYAEKLPINIPAGSFTLITGTPILIRIPREKYRAYAVEPKGFYDYVYWRSEHPIDLFLSQIENNLTKKYTEYFKFSQNPELGGAEKGDPLPMHFIQRFKFKKQISTRVPMKGFDQVVIGTAWEFEFDAGTNRDRAQFALDSGLGERNSLGFGFINIINK